MKRFVCEKCDKLISKCELVIARRRSGSYFCSGNCEVDFAYEENGKERYTFSIEEFEEEEDREEYYLSDYDFEE